MRTKKYVVKLTDDERKMLLRITEYVGSYLTFGPSEFDTCDGGI